MITPVSSKTIDLKVSPTPLRNGVSVLGMKGEGRKHSENSDICLAIVHAVAQLTLCWRIDYVSITRISTLIKTLSNCARTHKLVHRHTIS